MAASPSSETPRADIGAFGRLSDGRAVEAVRLGWPGGIEAQVLTWGATLRSLSVPGAAGREETLLQLPDLADYEADTRYLNPVIGRCANRLAGASFVVDGERFHIEANEGANALHGGGAGWNKRLWTLVEAGERRCVLSYASPDGEGGFPGAVDAEITFAITDAETLEIAWTATASRATPVNLTHHLYFNLSGDPAHRILEDMLRIAGDAVTPVGQGLIPTGAILPVGGTPFDLRGARAIGEVLAGDDAQLTLGKGLDLNWVLSPGADAAVTLACLASGVLLTVETDQSALQVYSGQGLTAPFVAHGALVLEPQGFPDAPNHADFPSVILRPGERYSRRAAFRLSTTSARP